MVELETGVHDDQSPIYDKHLFAFNLFEPLATIHEGVHNPAVPVNAGLSDLLDTNPSENLLELSATVSATNVNNDVSGPSTDRLHLNAPSNVLPPSFHAVS